MASETRKMRRVFIGAAAAAALVAGSGQLALADPMNSTLVASPTSLSWDVNGTTAGSFTVDLDANCGQSLTNGQTYVVDTVSGNSAVVASPSETPAVNCAAAPQTINVSSTAWNPTLGADNTAACAAVGTTTITATPVTGAPGQQKRLHATSVSVTVTDTGALCGGGGTGTGGNGGNPAAPAVANGDLNTDSALAAQCKSHFNNAKSWRGQTIKAVADQMPKPESVKDDPNVYPDNTWADFVLTMVTAICA